MPKTAVEPFAAYLLCARGMTDEFEVESFLYDTDLIDPFTLPDMEKACERIHKAIDSGERITVFGDYDADGVTSTALLYSYLNSCGAQVDCYIPDRADEGYGMNNRAIDSLKERGTQLIVTVDNGVSAIDEIEYAKSLGMDVVVTDHHRAGEVLPDAVAVVASFLSGQVSALPSSLFAPLVMLTATSSLRNTVTLWLWVQLRILFPLRVKTELLSVAVLHT